MHCKNCGKENGDHQIFCTACGARLSDGVTTRSMMVEKKDIPGTAPKSGNLLIIVLALLCVVAISAFALLWFLGGDSLGKKEKKQEDGQVEESVSSKDLDETTEQPTEEPAKNKFTTSSNKEDNQEKNQEKKDKFTKAESAQTNFDGFDDLSQEEKFSCTLEWLGKQEPDYKLLDYKANEQTPNPRDTSLEWDRTFFYTLEEISPTDPNDGQINYCNISKVRVKNKETNNLVECEIYKHPTTNEIPAPFLFFFFN